MTIGIVLSWIACGSFVGFVARLLAPGRQNMGLKMTMAVGIAGALMGGFIHALIMGAPDQPFSLSSNVFVGWTVAFVGSVLSLWACAGLYPARSWR
jgi:uncharacterized membrane protein YeaQ/YmgE (transglycosylase-associated protein family)